jgi:hypothetical protein
MAIIVEAIFLLASISEDFGDVVVVSMEKVFYVITPIHQ